MSYFAVKSSIILFPTAFLITSSAKRVAFLMMFFNLRILPLQPYPERKSIAPYENPKTCFPNSAFAIARNFVAR